MVAPFAPLGWVPGKIRFIESQGGMGPGDVCPQQRYATGEPGKVQVPDHVGIVKESCRYWVRGVSIRGKFVLSRNLGYKTRRVAN